jgi:hypothetical protein
MPDRIEQNRLCGGVPYGPPFGRKRGVYVVSDNPRFGSVPSKVTQDDARMDTHMVSAAKDQRQPSALSSILSLTLCTFSVTTAEFVIAGILPQVAAGLTVSIPGAGHIVTAYAIGMIVGGPLVTLLTVSIPRKPLMVGAPSRVRCGKRICGDSPELRHAACGETSERIGRGHLLCVGGCRRWHRLPHLENRHRPSRRSRSASISR